MSSTKAWGPHLWFSMFSIASNYPVKLDISNKEHKKIKSSNKSFFINFKYLLPCKYCRESYKNFLKELPIDDFLNSRRDLMYWLYLIKDKVNKKLLAQEEQQRQIVLNSNINKNKKDKILKNMFKTTPSPPFEEVCQYYEKFRAKCSDASQTCRPPTDTIVKLIEKNYKII